MNYQFKFKNQHSTFTTQTFNIQSSRVDIQTWRIGNNKSNFKMLTHNCEHTLNMQQPKLEMLIQIHIQHSAFHIQRLQLKMPNSKIKSQIRNSQI